MNIAIHDSEKESMPKKTFPNLALMRISGYHKQCGDTVSWFSPLERESYDIVYSSKIFSFTPENPYLPLCTIKGGSGHNVQSKLPFYIENAIEDYSIYPDVNYNIAFLTRGCIRHCPECIVPLKEGEIKPDFLTKGSVKYLNHRADVITGKWTDKVKKVVLMDNNFLSYKDCENVLESLSDVNFKIDFTQGLDCRLVTPEIAEKLAKIKWSRYTIRFACDSPDMLEPLKNAVLLIENARNTLLKNGLKLPKLEYFVYVLVHRDISSALEIVEEIHSWDYNCQFGNGFCRIKPFAQPFRDLENKIKITREQRRFARWVNHKAVFNSCMFSEYRG